MSNSLLYAIITGATCGDGCWHAREEICRCSCGGKNHGILRDANGKQPQRTCKIDGNFYELVGVIPASAHWRDVALEVTTVINERFPNLDSFAYGNYRQEKTMPVVDRKVSASQSKWPEVVAVPNAARLIWSRPAGTRYLIRQPNHTDIYNDANT